jgi:hypothetical protein
LFRGVGMHSPKMKQVSGSECMHYPKRHSVRVVGMHDSNREACVFLFCIVVSFQKGLSQ